MNRLLLRYVFSSLMIISVAGCEDEFFRLTNPPEFPWLTVSEYERAAVSPYHYSFFSGWGGGFFMTDRVARDGMTDYIYRIPGASANYPIEAVYLRQTNIDDSRNAESFSAGYNSIGLINSALDFYYDYNGDPFPNATESDRLNNVDRIAGELHFMRAFAYIHHCYRNCPPPGTPRFETDKILPLRKEFTDAEAALNPQIVTTREIYDFIIQDLLKAKELLPEKYIAGVHHPSYAYGRATKFTAHAILSRVYFQLGEWELAESELDSLIDHNNGLFGLSEDPFEAFSHSDNGQAREVVWQCIAYDRDHGQTVVPKDATLFTFLDYRAENGGLGEYCRRSTWHVFCMSNMTAKEIGWMDNDLNQTQLALQDKRYTQLYQFLRGNRGILDDPPCEYEQQYTNVKENRIWGNKYFRGTDGMHTNYPVYRLAEAYLTRSIIRIRRGDLQGAANDLNVVRARAWDPVAAGTAYENSSEFLSSSNITEEIIHTERLKELMFEGDRLIYLQALKMDLNPGERLNATAISFPYEGLYWVIPQDELDFRN